MAQPSCEDRIQRHLESRVDDFRVLSCLADVTADDLEPDELASSHELFHKAEALGVEALLHVADYGDDLERAANEIRESAVERVAEYPLGVSAYTTFRVEISTGGPAEWLEVVCSGDTPNYEPAGEGEHYEVDRIVFHFADWFDHAERQLEGDDLANAEAFARQVVPELVA